MAAADEAAQINAPTEGSTFAQATSTSSARYEIPDKWRGKWVEIQALTEDATVVFGDENVEAVHNDTNTVSSEAITLKDTVGPTIVAGTSKHRRIPTVYVDSSGAQLQVTHFAVIAAGTGRIEVALAHGNSPAGD